MASRIWGRGVPGSVLGKDDLVVPAALGESGRQLLAGVLNQGLLVVHGDDDGDVERPLSHGAERHLAWTVATVIFVK